MANSNLTADRLREIVSYDPMTGIMRCLKDRFDSSLREGDVLGSKHNKGYLSMSIDGTRYLAHRLAWLYMKGEWPVYGIDHRNGEKTDNRWANLRDVSQSVNMQNLKRAAKSSKSGILGVCWNKKDKRWMAQISANGAYKFLGNFKSIDDAKSAYDAAKSTFHVSGDE